MTHHNLVNEKKYRSFFEHGDLSDKHYFMRHSITNGDAVYVATADFPVFLDVFLSLSSSTRFDHYEMVASTNKSSHFGHSWQNCVSDRSGRYRHTFRII